MTAAPTSKLFDLLKCSVCSMEFNENRTPMQLKCYHNICCMCLDQVIQTAQVSNLDYGSCPSCKITFRLNDENDCYINSFMEDITNVINEAQKATTGGKCFGCEKLEKSLFCWDCNKGLCEGCSCTIHKINTGHKKIEPLSAIDSNKVIEIAGMKKEHCKLPNHSQKPLDYFCVNCKSLVCVDCAVVSHENHTKIVLVEAAEKYKIELEDKSNQLNEKCEETKKAIRELIDKNDQMLTDSKKSITLVFEQADKLVKVITDKRDEIVDNITSEIRSLTEYINGLVEELQMYVYYLEQCILESKLSLELSNPRLLLSKLSEISNDSPHKNQKLINIARQTNIEINRIPNNDVDMPASEDLFTNHVISGVVSEISVDFYCRGIGLSEDFGVVTGYKSNRCSIFSDHGDTIVSLDLPTDAQTMDVLINQTTIYVLDIKNKIYCYDIDGTYIKEVHISDNIEPFSFAMSGDKVFVSCNTSTTVYSFKTPDLDLIYMQKYIFQYRYKLPVELSGCLFLSANDQLLVVSDNKTHKVHAFKHDGEYVFTYGSGKPGAGIGQLKHPRGVCCHKDHIIIADDYNDRLVILSVKGKLLGYIKIVGPCDLEVGQDGHMRVLRGLQAGPWSVTTLRYKII